jgi:hypothetical protein
MKKDNIIVNAEVISIPNCVDYSLWNKEGLKPWQELINYNLPLGKQLIDICKQIVYLPNNWQYELLIAYICTPSALSNILPIMCLYGAEGTGKSLINIFASVVWGKEINTGNDTLPALRNKINSQKWIYDEKTEKKYEQNCLLIWDDLNLEKLLENSDYTTLLKVGYNRYTSKISIAQPKGGVISFDCFSTKIISSISPIWGNTNYAELKRRVLVCQTKKIPDFKGLDIFNIDWSGFNGLITNFWENIGNIKTFVENRKSLIKTLSHSDKDRLILDVASTGLTLNIWENVNEVKHFFNNYWQWFNNSLAFGDSAFLELLNTVIKEKEKLNIEAKKALNLKHLELIIEPKELKTNIELWCEQGMLEVKPSPEIISKAMQYLGWKLKARKWVKL